MFNLPPDPYKALGVSKDAQLPEIRSAHRKLILKCHPDKVQDPQQKAEKQAEFQKVQQAYELLNDELARSKYDEKVRYNEKYGELEKEKEKAKRCSSPPPTAAQTPSRSRPSYYEPEIRTAEPRASTFTKTGTSPSSRKFYESGFSSSRSFEEVPGSSSRAYDEPRRSSKKSASYERERDREWEREQEREKEREKLERRKRKEKEAEEYAAREREREKEREREQRDRIKQAAKEVDEVKKKKDRREKDKKKADKERKRDAEDKHRRHKHYSEPYHGEESDVDDAVPTSSSRKEDTTLDGKVPTTDRERKNSANLQSAIRYLERSGAKPALSRSPTYQDTPSYRHVAPPVAAPTPPPATASAHPPPPPPPVARDIDVEEDGVRRSSGRSSRTKPPDALRSSPRESRDKSSHRKSGTRSASRDAARPTIVEVAPGVARVPPLQKSYSDPHRVMQLNRSYTDTYSRPTPHPPGLERQNTWQQGDDRERTTRGRRGPSFSDGSEDDGHYHRHSRRTQSPEPMVTPTTHRYAVAADGKTRRKYTAAEAVPIPTRGHKVKHATANTSSPRAEPGLNGYYQDEYGADPPAHAAFNSVNYSPMVREDEIQYSNLQRGYSSSYNKDPYSTTVY